MKATLYDTDNKPIAELDMPPLGVHPHILVYKGKGYAYRDQGVKHGQIYRETTLLILEDEPTQGMA